MNDDPIAFFITWTVYGTHLQGDQRGWRKRRKGNQLPQPRLAEWRLERLKHEVLLLSPDQRAVVEHECRRHCEHRGWQLWAINARTNHVHAVVTAVDLSGKIVRDQLKANCTRGLRERWPVYCDRPVWTVGGDWECINSADDLESACQYVTEAQDHKLDQPMGMHRSSAGTDRTGRERVPADCAVPVNGVPVQCAGDGQSTTGH